MRVIQVREFGGPEVLVPEEAPAPVAGPGQAVVRLTAADVIFLDTLLRAGAGQDFFPHIQPPYVPGNGGAGRVLSVGEGVDPAWVGRPVLAADTIGYAEQVVVTAADLIPVPEGVDLIEATALLTDGPTALSLTALGGAAKGEWVLVTSAAGGAGSLLVQLARDAGARVIAAARGARKLELARELGAEVTVDYSDDGWDERVRAATGGSGVDLVFDGAGGALGETAFTTVADGGRFLTYGSSTSLVEIDPATAERRQVQVTTLMDMVEPQPDAPTRGELAVRALALAADGKIRPAIGATFPLERAADAHASLAARATVGKSLLLL